MIVGESGTSVKLTLYRTPTNETVDLIMIRQAITVPLVTYQKLGGNVGYIRLNSFGEQTISQLKKAFVDLQGVDFWWNSIAP